MLINSLQNKFVKELNSLKMSKSRRSLGKYILEGIKPVLESMKTDLCESVYHCPELLDGKTDLPKDSACEFIEVSRAVFQKITTLENPEGILSVNKLIESNLDSHFVTQPFLVLDRIMDPGNMGTLIRSADAFGFKNIVLLEGCSDPFNPKCTRSSMGSILRVRMARSSIESFLKLLDENGDDICLIGLDMSGESIINNKSKVCGLLIGSESHGLSGVFDAVLTNKFRIEMVGEVESLNAAIAGSIAMHTIGQLNKS